MVLARIYTEKEPPPKPWKKAGGKVVRKAGRKAGRKAKRKFKAAWEAWKPAPFWKLKMQGEVFNEAPPGSLDGK